ncbi:MAG: LysM peptidoglycan-binding domain-containing protein, partial [Muribaculaceae bacterium]|nr:LysM peptidoglycan-binding domain-containing protein [Muribaculaceae bacterium]
CVSSVAASVGLAVDSLAGGADSIAAVPLEAPVDVKPAAPKEQPKPKPQPKPKTSGKTHKVVKGDTLWSISQKYGTTVEKLRRANGLTAKSKLQIGQKLQIP